MRESGLGGEKKVLDDKEGYMNLGWYNKDNIYPATDCLGENFQTNGRKFQPITLETMCKYHLSFPVLSM